MDRFRWCTTPTDTQITDPESSVLSQSGVTLYNGPGKTGFEDGILTLTSHRLIWQQGKTKMALPLAAVTSVTQQQTSSIRKATPKLILKLLTPEQLVNAFKAMPARPLWSAPWVVDKGDSRVAVASGLEYIRLGFTQGGIQSFQSALDSTLEVSESAFLRKGRCFIAIGYFYS